MQRLPNPPFEPTPEKRRGSSARRSATEVWNGDTTADMVAEE